MRLGFLLRWSLRDLRHRWIQVTAVALIIAVGTGVYAGLGSTAAWRQESNDASFAALGMYDLRVVAATGADAPAGTMLAALGRLPDPGVVGDAEERLVLPTQVDASTTERTVLVPGRIIGVDTRDGGPAINAVWVERDHGRTLREGDRDVAVLERSFATFYDLPPTGELEVGGRGLPYVGVGSNPEYFLVTSDDGGFFAEANLAVLFVPLATAQELTGRPGRVNDLVLRLRPGADPAAVAGDVEAAFAGAGLAVTVMDRDDEDAYRLLYDDIEGDRTFWNVVAALVLAGAAFGAFNLASRMVEAERRQIGIGMALGAPPGRLAVRPLLVGLEIAVLGVILGVLMGWLVTAAIRPVFTSVLPLPVWHTEFQLAPFARGAVLGVILPVVATAWPVWRAVRVTPVEAIATAHRTASGGWSVVLRRLPWPRSAFARMPIGNVLRAPRRTLLTAFGVGAAVTALLSTTGMIDSFLATVDRHDREVLADHPDRVDVALQGFEPVGGAVVAAVAAEPVVGAVQPVLRVGARMSVPGGEPVDVLIDVTDVDGAVWRPSIVRGTRPMSGEPGLVISAEAAADLGVAPGDEVAVEHPAWRGGGLETTTTRIRIAAVHPSPFRFPAYLDRSALAALELPDVANRLYVLPAAGATPADVQRALFGADGVASAQPVSAASDVVRDSLDDFVGIFRVLEGFVLLLALLIAYNATRIADDERAREHATLFAFGLPPRRVLAMDVVENLVIGAIGTALGIAAGLAVLGWYTSVLIARTLPELGIDVALSVPTLLTAVVLGVVAVAAAPLLMIRRRRRMDVPGTLRIVE